MTVRSMIKLLSDYPMDYQVVDTNGSPIMYMLFHDRESKAVRLEPKSQMDINEELDALFDNALEESLGDKETLDELLERGYTLEDLKEYKEDTYNWALSAIADYEVEDEWGIKK